MIKDKSSHSPSLVLLSIFPLLVLCLSYSKAVAGNVTIVQPTNYVVANLGVGSKYYIDRTYTLTKIPSQLTGGQWIMTANADKNNTSSSFLVFNIAQSSTVYVAYDPRATSVPNWLTSNFVNTGLTIGTTDAGFNLYKASFSAGTVTLGGNKAAGAVYPDGVSGTNYVVIVIATSPTPTPTPTPTPGPISGWTVVDDSGKTSNWQVANGIYTQQNWVGGVGSALMQTYHLGSYLYASSGFSFTDYTVTLNVTLLSPTSGDPGDDVGVMFRYQDNQNYYRFSISYAWGFARLEKKVNGVFSTLAHNGRGTDIPGQKQSITIVVISNKILVYLNGEPLFSVQDSSLSSGTIALYCRNKASFNSVSVNTNSSAPSIIISTPVSYSVETSNTLGVSAVATNVPTGGGVEFVLDSGVQSFFSCSKPYSGQFSGVSQGEHTVDAFLLDSCNASGNTLSDDMNVVGVLGDYYVSDGDSITFGVGDNFSLDGSSQDGGIIAEHGYESNLTDLLTSSLNYPNIVFSEGVPADQSIDALNRVGSIIERHTEANKVLILLGTNDSSGTMPVPSGLGCSGSSCNGTFYQNMQTLVNTLSNSGKAPIVALILPAFGSCSTCTPYTNPSTASRNQLIQQYNQVIKNQITGIQVGPNLYSSYINHFDLFSDNLHPNGLGYPIMAYLWRNSLLGRSDLPFFVGNITPNNGSSPPNYKQNLLQVGNQYYVDRTYTLTSIPSELQGNGIGNGIVWIMTGNNDKDNTSTNFLSFNIPQNSTVYVGYDPRATSVPNWLANSFVNTGLTIGTTDAGFNLYKKDFSAGTVTLGGNKAAGAVYPSGVGGANYVVIVKKK